MNLTGEGLAEIALGATSRKDQISRLENAKIPKPHESTVKKICDALKITEAEMAPIRQARPSAAQLDHIPTLSRNELILLASLFEIDGAVNQPDAELRRQLELKAARYRENKYRISELEKTVENLQSIVAEAREAQSEMRFDVASGLLDQIYELSKFQLEALALKFSFSDPHSASHEELVLFLSLKAEEYKALKAEVDTISEDMKRLSNLKIAAQDAIARVDLDEVEHLLSLVQEAELDEAAKTAEMRASNALLRGKVDQAYRLLSAAADSFAAIDPLEPARRRILQYWEILQNHGLRFGGHGLPKSRDLLAPVLTEKLKATDPWLWAAGQNSKAVALQQQGTRTAGPDGAGLFSEAVAAYRSALEVYSIDAHPEQWAMIQNNLSITLKEQGSRTAGKDGADLLREAVTAYRSALEVRTRDAHPVQWAMTQNNLGEALRNQGTRTDGQDGADLLAEAVAAYHRALEVRTRDAHPVDWAMTQNNLGTALRNQGSRTAGKDGADLLREAIAAYRSALEVRTRDAHPVDWAMTQENIAIAEEERAEHEITENPRPHLQAALEAVEAALTVFDPEHLSYNHAKATRLRDCIQAKLDALPPG